jgi:hypothetical protein
MAAPFDAAVVVHRQLVARRQLPRQAQGGIGQPLIVERLLARRRKRVAEEIVGAPAAQRAEEPEPVLHDRPAECQVDVVDRVDAILRPEAERHELVIEVVALHAGVGAGRERAAVELIAAIARNHVDLHAADRRFRRQ